ncbi:MAG: PilT/PilU family type 4a pilus ATPase [Myxococcales bacterium]|nr:PilT/PilU family type 4a pilus ATPase [Myxococcales bacterium]
MIIDQLLKLVEAQAAQALVIRSGAPPVLERRGGKVALSMPSLDPEMVEMILEEVASPAQRGDHAAIATGIEVEYRSADQREYQVAISRTGAELRLAFRPISAATRAAALARPSEAPVPAEPPSPPVGVATAPRPAPIEPTPSRATDRAGATQGVIDRTLARAQHEGASDVFFASGMAVRLRVGGGLVELDDVVEESELREFFAPLLHAERVEELRVQGSTDLAVEHHDGGRTQRWRANLFRRHGGLSAALRPIRTEVPSLRELNLPDDFLELTQHRTGLVLVTGMAGSGKSTTLVALVEHVNRTAAKHVLTLEDPIEYEYRPARALVQQREIGRDVADFATGLRAALRESPDIILLGEMRDRETISAALTAAETGHLVLATLHAGSAAMAIDRIVDVFPEHQQSQVRTQLAGVLRAVVTQVLLPSTRPPARVPAYEKLLVNTAVGAKIRELRGHQIQSEIQKGRAEGMVSLELSMAKLVRAGRLAMDVALAHAGDPNLLAELVRQS